MIKQLKNDIINITECPRDAMQGIKEFIPTNKKVRYINSLLKVGFDLIDFGSFVSPKTVPQMKDTSKVVGQLQLSKKSSLLSIVLNRRGALDACSFDEIEYLGYPFSISNVFQLKNSNKTIEESIPLVDELNNLCGRYNKKLLIYISMAFGNCFNDHYDLDIVFKYVERLSNLGIKHFTLADTIGVSSPNLIESIFKELQNHENQNFGLHLHSSQEASYAKIESAFNNGCRRFDSTISGIGGCPFAEDELIGNVSTQTVMNFIQNNKIKHNLNNLNLETAFNESKILFKF